MANDWLRLWHDMPNDPKWRTIARVSKQPICLVVSVYVHLLVTASRNVTRGHADVTVEDLASALDCDEPQIQAVLDAMQGRVLDGMRLTGWESRQPKREDAREAGSSAKSAAERKADQRAREKTETPSRHVTVCHDMSRHVTTDTDTDTEVNPTNANALVVASGADDEPAAGSADSKTAPPVPNCPQQALLDLYAECLPELPQPRVWDGQPRDNLRARWRWVLTATKRGTGERYAESSEEGLVWFRKFFGYVSGSDFLMGRKGDWQADLYWLVKAANFGKVLSGTYENERSAA